MGIDVFGIQFQDLMVGVMCGFWVGDFQFIFQFVLFLGVYFGLFGFDVLGCFLSDWF